MNRNRSGDRDVPRDLGTSSDRAMYDDSSEERITNSGGISKRDLDREQSERRQVPERGSSRGDAGRTSGGGSGGHTPTREVQESGSIRNVPDGRDDDGMMDTQTDGTPAGNRVPS